MAAPVLKLSDVQTAAQYAPVTDTRPSTQAIPESDWSDDYVDRIHRWIVTPLDATQTLAIGASFLEEIQNGTISIRTASSGLRLALSLISPDSTITGPLITQRAAPAAGHADAAYTSNMPTAESFPDANFTIRNIQQLPLQNPPLEQGAVLPVAGAPQPAPVIPQNPAQDNDTQKRYSYCFIAAYLMKLLIKTDDNVLNGLPVMKARFESFYGPAATVANFSITKGQALAYKDALGTRDKFMATYTHALANTQSNPPATHGLKESGILSYLGYLPFSYTGLQAYTLLMELQKFSRVNLGTLLTLFHADINAPALAKIVYILTNFERTEAAPNRSTWFRYCSTWGPQYFSSIRAKNCTHLLYTVAWAWKTLHSGHERADPENIIAVQTLSTSMKNTLRAAGKIIGESLKANMLGGAGASPAYGLALNTREENAAVEEEWEDLVN